MAIAARKPAAPHSPFTAVVMGEISELHLFVVRFGANYFEA